MHGCDMAANTFTIQVHGFSTFALSALLAPKIEHFSATVAPVRVGAPVQASATIQDAEQNDSYTVTWDWGDGTVTTQLTTGPELKETHRYTEPGMYRLTLTVAEDAGSDTATYEFVVVYNPAGGSVIGAGWINSPAGACRLEAGDETTTGKANFGFVSKYLKGAHIPMGVTVFDIKACGLEFISARYKWLVVTGSKAIYKGYGTINGAGNYGFIISAIDAGAAIHPPVDLFRIKIWDVATGTVVYDNQMDAAEDANPTTTLGRGSIVVHRR